LRSSKSDVVRTYGACGAIASSWTNLANKEKYSFTSCGYSENTPTRFFQTNTKRKIPTLKSLVKVPPDQIIISLGTNYVSEKNSRMIMLDISDLLDQLIKYSPNTQCIWIGPPDSRKFHHKMIKINRTIKNFISSECTYFDSFNQTQYPVHGGDGVHFYGSEPLDNEAKKWAQNVYQFLIPFNSK